MQKSVQAVSLTEGLWQQLQAVNTHINQTVTPVTDEDLYQVRRVLDLSQRLWRLRRFRAGQAP